MTWQNFSDFFSQLFTGLTLTDSLVLLLALLGAYLIGWFFTRLYYRQKMKQHREAMIEKDKIISELKIKQDSLIGEIELKMADLKKVELALGNLQSEYDNLQLEKEAWVETKDIQAATITQLKEELSVLQVEVPEVGNLPDSSPDLVNASSNQTLIEEWKNLFQQTEQRMIALEARVQELEQDETELIIVEAEDLEETEEEEIDLVAEARVEAAKKIINKALGESISEVLATEKDDLKKINGIGPFIEQKLNELGIYTYQQISQFDKAFIQSLTEAIQFFPGRIERDDWVGQAKELL